MGTGNRPTSRPKQSALDRVDQREAWGKGEPGRVKHGLTMGLSWVDHGGDHGGDGVGDDGF